MEGGITEEEPRFRQFRPEDMEACTRLAWEAWAAGPEETDEEVDPRVMEGYVRSFMVRSNWNEVAYDSHGVVGLLFGRIARGKGEDAIRSSLSELSFVPRFLFNRYGQSISPIVLWHFFMTEFKVLVNEPRSDAEINLLIVDSKHRGRRLGTKLIDRFVTAAREAGSRLLTLYTDDQVSNWKFYEIYGFRRVATFPDGLTSYFAERDANGIVYALDLK